MDSLPSSSPEYEKLKSLSKRSRGVILDFDGLLADSEPFHYKAYNEVFERYDHSLDPEEYWVEWTSKGNGIAGEIKRHNLQLDVDIMGLRRQKFEVYSKFCRDGDIALFPETRRLAEILGVTHKLAIASGSWRHDIQAILDHAGMRRLFPIIHGKESASREKPHPDIFLKSAESLDLEPGACLVIEDALKGLAAAKKAGIPCIIIRNKLNQKIDFDGADLVLSNLGELTDWWSSPY